MMMLIPLHQTHTHVRAYVSASSLTTSRRSADTRTHQKNTQNTGALHARRRSFNVHCNTLVRR